MASKIEQMYQPTSRYFRHVTKFSSCDVVEIHAGYGRMSAHHYSDHNASVGPSGSMHTKSSIESYVAAGRWIEITLDELLGKQGVLTPVHQLFSDMHQSEPGDPPNPLYPTKEQASEQRMRAQRFHDMWRYYHPRWQRQLRGASHISWRYDCYDDQRMQIRHDNKVRGLARRLWLGQVGLFSDDPKVAFAAQFTALSKLIETSDDNFEFSWAWTKLQDKTYQRGWPFNITEAIATADNKRAYGDWSTPYFPGLKIKESLRWHFVHTSKADPTKVAYAKDWRALWSLIDPTIENKTDATNKFVTTTPGKYLTKFYGDELTEVQIRDMAAACVAEALPPVLHIATTEADIIKAIAEGPTESCMANGYHHNGNREKYGWFNSPVHPAAIYASGDIEVLYLKNVDGEITARAIANAATKEVARIYGDKTKMLKGMAGTEYKQQEHALVGCCVRKILFDDDRKIVMAYVDAGIGSGGGSLYAEDEGDDSFLRLVSGENSSYYNTYDGYSNKGYSDAKGHHSSHVCEACDDDVYDADDLTTVTSRSGGEIEVCESCLNNYHYAIGRHGDESWHHRDRCIQVSDSWYVERYASDNGLRQAECGPSSGEWFHEDDLRYTENGYAHESDCTKLDIEHNGYSWALDDVTEETEDGDTIHTDDARPCEITGQTWHKKDMIRIEEKLPGPTEGFSNRVWIHPDAIVDEHERVTVWYPIPMRAAVLVIDHPEIGFGVAEFDFSGEEFKNVLIVGDDADLPDALGRAYDEHHEETEELEAA